MLFHIQTLTIASLFSTLATSRPFGPAGLRPMVPRGKSYAVVNVGGDSPTAPPPATSIVKMTTTVEVVQPGKTITKEVTATVVEPYPVAAPTSCSNSSSISMSSSSASSSAPSPSTPCTTPLPTPTSAPAGSPAQNISTPIETPKPIIVTVTVSEDGPTQYYDNGMWHTYYEIKTFDGGAAS
ncbi:hypothetical protein ACJQWK_04984 [Exserohilum turcicum]|uniref:Uncharacterized protein n=1 Tax=Exserohilum turcicum (strain 28A) TaxID=671987 RepID=R0IBI0_EXST2|nr:uncharacterized protein SETTUDRAFT_156438 [Exserohilum turcica Et28A]EOA82760.1 hypothetical protein SETTUDRAFT_156438 [Exserohilum turcica Et28A]